MKKALVDPRDTDIKYVSSVDVDGNYIFTIIPNSARICDVAENEFEVASPLYWIDCSDETIVDEYYCDTINNTAIPIPESA